MNLIEEHNKKYAFFKEITGVAMQIHREYRPGLLEQAYQAALKYLLTQKQYKVQKQVLVPMYWKNVVLDEYYRLDLLVNDSIIIELKATKQVISEHRRQLHNYMRLTHIPYGMLINFGMPGLYSEWYELDTATNEIDKVTLM
jgi:GxxExxY protein